MTASRHYTMRNLNLRVNLVVISSLGADWPLPNSCCHWPSPNPSQKTQACVAEIVSWIIQAFSLSSKGVSESPVVTINNISVSAESVWPRRGSVCPEWHCPLLPSHRTQ